MRRPVHFEILADDPGKIADFYKSVFNWEIASWEGGEEAYLLVTTGPEDVPGINGGIMGRSFQQAVINTIEVESLEEMLKVVDQAGGKTVFGPNEIPGVGIHAYCADPEGNLFGMMQPAEEMG
ncbi:MAG: VOC family protein [Anaerolineales bacterium]|nr:VOC family protein [Anaerolineales bacterium]